MVFRGLPFYLSEEGMPKKYNVLKLIDKLTEGVGNFTSFGIPLLGLLILYEVIMRYVFNSPTIWVHDTSQFLFGATYMLGGAFTLMLRKHVNMDMLYVRFSERGKALSDAATGVLVIIFLGVLVWQSGVMAYESIIFNEVYTQSVFEPPLYPIKIIFFLACILFLLQALVQFLRDLTTIITKSEKTANPKLEER